MPRRRNPRINREDVSKRVDLLKGEIPVDEMEGLDLAFVTNLLTEYAGLVEMSISCRESIERDGILIEEPRGGKDNRSMRKVENPAFGTYYKCISRMGDLATKISKFAKQAVQKIEEEDDDNGLGAFILRR